MVWLIVIAVGLFGTGAILFFCGCLAAMGAEGRGASIMWTAWSVAAVCAVLLILDLAWIVYRALGYA